MQPEQRNKFDIQKFKSDFIAKKLDNDFNGEQKEALSRLFQEREFTGSDFGKHKIYLTP